MMKSEFVTVLSMPQFGVESDRFDKHNHSAGATQAVPLEEERRH
jgi:hypothetical protein